MPVKLKKNHSCDGLKQGGFTLIELVSVIVILSIVAAMGSAFIVNSQTAYHQAQARAKLINKSRQSLERIMRQLRGAVPYSYSTATANCIKFLPLAGGGNYLSPLPSSANGAAATNLINTAPNNLELGAASAARFVTVGAMSAAEIYSSAVSIAPLQTHATTSLTLSSNKIWQRNSINQRFYLADNPQAFCVVGGQLNFYRDQAIAGTAVATGSGAEVMAVNVSVPAGASAFVISPGIEDRNIRVTINLDFTESGETVSFAQEVSLRNVP